MVLTNTKKISVVNATLSFLAIVCYTVGLFGNSNRYMDISNISWAKASFDQQLKASVAPSVSPSASPTQTPSLFPTPSPSLTPTNPGPTPSPSQSPTQVPTKDASEFFYYAYVNYSDTGDQYDDDDVYYTDAYEVYDAYYDDASGAGARKYQGNVMNSLRTREEIFSQQTLRQKMDAISVQDYSGDIDLYQGTKSVTVEIYTDLAAVVFFTTFFSTTTQWIQIYNWIDCTDSDCMACKIASTWVTGLLVPALIATVVTLICALWQYKRRRQKKFRRSICLFSLVSVVMSAWALGSYSACFYSLNNWFPYGTRPSVGPGYVFVMIGCALMGCVMLLSGVTLAINPDDIDFTSLFVDDEEIEEALEAKADRNAELQMEEDHIAMTPILNTQTLSSTPESGPGRGVGRTSGSHSSSKKKQSSGSKLKKLFTAGGASSGPKRTSRSGNNSTGDQYSDVSLNEVVVFAKSARTPAGEKDYEEDDYENV